VATSWFKRRGSMKLDAGCGSTPQGDVNCDLFIMDAGHRTGTRDKFGEPINPKRIKNFIVCDVQHLPFRSNVFEVVYSSHVIEHVSNPLLFLRELVRVSNWRITLLCPHRLGDRLLNPPNPFHKSYFSSRWFERAIQLLGCFGVVTLSKIKLWPSNLLPLLHVPYEIQADFFKDKDMTYGFKNYPSGQGFH
jgi:hypothetical protein